MAGRRVHFVMPDSLVARIDAALVEGQSRGEFVRRAVEQALGESSTGTPVKERVAPVTPAPAERPYAFEQERQAVRTAVDVGAKKVRVEMGSALPRGRHAPTCKCPVCS